MLTQSILKEHLIYNHDTGFFYRNTSTPKGRRKAGGYTDKGYLCITVNGKEYFSHRLAWLYIYGKFPYEGIDHINGKKDDNRICNLRECTQSENCQNQRKAKINNKTGLLGVSKNQNKFSAHISINGKQTLIGSFDTAKLAHEAYLESKRKHHEFCTI